MFFYNAALKKYILNVHSKKMRQMSTFIDASRATIY